MAPGAPHAAAQIVGAELDANAVILGPAVIGDRVKVGAGAVVVGDAPAG